MKDWRSLAFSVAFYDKFATFSSSSKKIKFFFSKNPPYFSGKKPKIRTFWKFSISQCHCRANLLLLLILKQPRFLSKTHLFFFNKKSKSRTFRENLLIWMHSASKWLLLAVSNETQGFFRITNLVFQISVFERVEKYH